MYPDFSCFIVAVSSGRGSAYGASCNNSAASMALPPNVDSDLTVWASVTKAGGRITLPDTGKSRHHILVLPSIAR